METLKIKNTIELLSKPSFGSFGEYLFKKIYNENNKKNKIVPKHKNRTDFIINNQKVDVKSRRFLDIKYTKSYFYKSNEFQNIEYPTVCFYIDCIVILYKNFKFILEYHNLENYYNNWIIERNKRPTKINKDKDKYDIIWKDLKSELESYIHNVYNKDSYIFNRTKDWGKNTPHNLLPIYTKNKKKRIIVKDQIRVFIQFNNYKISKDNIKLIIAYNEKDYKKLFKILPAQNAPLSNGNWKKVDITKIPKKIKYKNLNEFKENLKNIN